MKHGENAETYPVNLESEGAEDAAAESPFAYTPPAAGSVWFDTWRDAKTHEHVAPEDWSRNRRCDVARADGEGGHTDAAVMLHIVFDDEFRSLINWPVSDDARGDCAEWISQAHAFSRNFNTGWLREETGALTAGPPTLQLEPRRNGKTPRYALSWPCSGGGGLIVVNAEGAIECGACFGCAAARVLPRPRVESWVYFVQATTGGPVKIGRSSSPQARVASLQTANAAELRIVAMVPGGATVERAMHATFAAERVRPGGEWFHPSPTLAAFVRELGGKIA